MNICLNCANEIWKDVAGYEGKYQISNLGKVKSLICWCGNKNLEKYKVCEKLLNPTKSSNGYYMVSLLSKNKRKSTTVHKLVAEAFILNPNNYPVINHIDGNKLNNNVSNLEWCTYQHNTQEAIKNGLLNPSLNASYSRKGKFGKYHNRSKLVQQIDKKTNKIIRTFYGVQEASRETGINDMYIYAVTNGIRKSANGYIWRYVNE